jgi:hypothetical protein
MSEFKIAVDLSSVMNAVPIITRAIFPLLNEAVDFVAQQTRADWMQAVYKAKLWSREKDAYATSITWRMTGDFSAVVETGYKYAEEIENGRPPKDLKRMLDTSRKVRRTKDGKRYLIIPMRHNTPGNDALAQPMPQYVYDMASQMKASRVIGVAKRATGEMTSLHPQWGMKVLKRQTPFASNIKARAPMMVRQRQYSWGEKLPALAMANKQDASRYGNMYRFDTRTPGGKKSSKYLTFRVMMEGSPGWIVPAQPGQHIAQGVAQAMEPYAEKFFREAIARSFK